ncbi:MAG: hypothetical protein KDC44_02755 [Phaeodactylibacter sp.]|nr:hypothetical protein [Phaeodactylibacter sp.]
MQSNFKPDGYASVSPYFVVKDPQGLKDLLETVFKAEAPTTRPGDPDKRGSFKNPKYIFGLSLRK